MKSSRAETEPKRGPDVGSAAVDQIYRLWQVDDAWSVREHRGFTWWAGDFRQRVFVDAGRDVEHPPTCLDAIEGVFHHDTALVLSLAPYRETHDGALGQGLVLVPIAERRRGCILAGLAPAKPVGAPVQSMK
jgi:hypothetical protein